jgi:hypothetical protein
VADLRTLISSLSWGGKNKTPKAHHSKTVANESQRKMGKKKIQMTFNDKIR